MSYIVKIRIAALKKENPDRFDLSGFVVLFHGY